MGHTPLTSPALEGIQRLWHFLPLVFICQFPHLPVTLAVGQMIYKMKTGRHTRIYLLIMVMITAFGLPSRIVQDQLPTWYVLYFGDYLWAMLLFFLFALILRNMSTFKVAITTLCFTYIIETSQLFHPQWLDYLRSIKLFALVLGYDFLWSDIVAYTLGISTGALVEYFLLRNNAKHKVLDGNEPNTSN